jgi:DNA-directed RNA polymerase delta subunit
MVNVSALVKQILGIVPERTREILSRRFGLQTGSPETLEKIGATLSITRERVRQIEKSGLAILMKKLPKEMDAFFKVADEHFKSFRGVREEDRFLRELSYLFHEDSSRLLQIRFLLFLDKRLFYFPEDKTYRAFWTNDQKAARKVISFVHQLDQSFLRRQSPVTVDTIEPYILQYAQKVDLGKIEIGILSSYLCLSKVIVLGPFGYIGADHLKEIAPVNVGEKAYLVLRHSKVPMHFRDLTGVINNQAKMASSFHPVWQKTVEAQTVHNELIKNDQFVLIGRGLYALKEWGYQQGTVKEVIQGILSQAKRSLSFREIVEKVKKSKIVKDATVLINLQNKKFFKRLPDKTYALARPVRKIERI